MSTYFFLLVLRLATSWFVDRLLQVPGLSAGSLVVLEVKAYFEFVSRITAGLEVAAASPEAFPALL